MNRRKLKQEILQILEEDDLNRIRHNLVQFSPNQVINPLFSALCSPDEKVKWHAVSAFGWVVPALADVSLESARVVMRRFLWTLNDESGGIGWGAPEAMAEIMAEDTRLADEYLHMLISYTRDDGPEPFQDGNYLELPMLQRGLLWGIGRLCYAHKRRMQHCRIGADLQPYLASPDRVVRGLALWALIALEDGCAAGEAAGLQVDNTEVSIYFKGKTTICSVSELAAKYLQGVLKIKESM